MLLKHNNFKCSNPDCVSNGRYKSIVELKDGKCPKCGYEPVIEKLHVICEYGDCMRYTGCKLLKHKNGLVTPVCSVAETCGWAYYKESLNKSEIRRIKWSQCNTN